MYILRNTPRTKKIVNKQQKTLLKYPKFETILKNHIFVHIHVQMHSTNVKTDLFCGFLDKFDVRFSY